MDKRVEIHGTSRTEMNGKRGVAVDFHCFPADRTKDRYAVQLDSGDAFKVRPANVRAEQTSAELPPEKLYEMAFRVFDKTRIAVDPSGSGSWPPLSASQQKEMDGAIVMMQEATDQVSGRVRDSVAPGGARAHHFAQPYSSFFRGTSSQLRPSAICITGVMV